MYKNTTPLHSIGLIGSIIILLLFSCQATVPNNETNAETSIDSAAIDTIPYTAPKFPEDWVGLYKGDLQWFAGKNSILVPISIEIKAIDSLENTYLWRSTYDSTERFPMVVKDYILVHPDTLPEGHFLIDEKNGIYLDMILIDNSFYSCFEVNKTLLLSIDRLNADGSIYHEIISSHLSGARESGATSDDSYFGVKSYSRVGTQKAILKRVEGK